MLCTLVYLHFTALAACSHADLQKILKAGGQMSIVADIHMVIYTDAKKPTELSDCFGSRPLFNGHEGTRRRPPRSIGEDLSTQLHLCRNQLVLFFCLTPANNEPISQPFQTFGEVLKMAGNVW